MGRTGREVAAERGPDEQTVGECGGGCAAPCDDVHGSRSVCACSDQRGLPRSDPRLPRETRAEIHGPVGVSSLKAKRSLGVNSVLRISVAPVLVALWAGSSQAADLPGQTFNISSNSLAAPFATPASANSSLVIARPAGATPQVPAGFTASLFATDLFQPRWMLVAPDGDVFLTQPDAGKVSLLRETNGKVTVHTFATGFDGCHGLALHDGALYVGDRKAVWRLPYADGALKATSRARVTKPPTLGRPGGHFTRDIVFDSKGTLYVAIGSRDNLEEDPLPEASVQKVMPDGTLSTYASGVRNAVGIAFYPGTDNLFVTVNERDGLGDALPPDYFTHVEPGAFYGWPYAYIGPHPDPGFGARRPDLVRKTKVPDLLFQAHSAPLGLVFY